MKKLFSVFIFSQLFFIVNCCAKDQYSVYASRWVKEYIFDQQGDLRIPLQDLKVIRELIQLSADRAELTLQAQEIALQTITTLRQAWHNLSMTRLNPSHARPHVVNRAACCSLEEFWNIMDAQEACCAAYSRFSQKVVYEDALLEKSSKDAVAEFRAQARIFMVDSLADVKKQLGGLYDIAFNKSLEIDLQQAEEDLPYLRMINIAEFILSYVPNLAMHSFIHADKAHNMISAEGWSVLEKIEQIGNQVWDAIEKARLAFYRALSDELDTYVDNENIG